MRRNPSWPNKIITQQLIEWGSSGRVDVYSSIFWAQFMLATPLLCRLEVSVSCEDSPKSTDKDLRSIWLFKRRIGVFFGFVFLSASSWAARSRSSISRWRASRWSPIAVCWCSSPDLTCSRRFWYSSKLLEISEVLLTPDQPYIGMAVLVALWMLICRL